MLEATEWTYVGIYKMHLDVTDLQGAQLLWRIYYHAHWQIKKKEAQSHAWITKEALFSHRCLLLQTISGQSHQRALHTLNIFIETFTVRKRDIAMFIGGYAYNLDT